MFIKTIRTVQVYDLWFEKIEKIEFASKKRYIYKTGSQYTTKENITKGEAKSQVFIYRSSANSYKLQSARCKAQDYSIDRLTY